MKQLVLFLLYSVIGGLSLWVLSMQINILSALWLCLLGFGALFFALEQRTGLTAREKYRPLLLLLTIVVWVQMVRYRSLMTLPVALMATASCLFEQKSTFPKATDSQDK